VGCDRRCSPGVVLGFTVRSANRRPVRGRRGCT
jgi:hypothetical protein